MNSRKPLFSIVMPAYNVEPFIGDAIGSIQGQSIRDWELVVVDDASSDGTAEVVRRAASEDARVRLVRHEENRGASAARNTGIDAADGLYLWLPDPDDLYDHRLLEECAFALADNPASITVFGVAEVYLGEDGTVKRTHEATFPAARCAHAEELRPLVLPLEQSTLYGYSANKVYDLGFLRATGVRWEDAPLIEDFFFNVRVFQDAPSMNVLPGAPYRYARRPSGSLTREFVAEYYPLHRRRIFEMREQLRSWGLLDDAAREVLGALFARYILSAAERSFDVRSGMDADARTAWLSGVFEDELFCDLMPHARAGDPLLRVALVPIRRCDVGAVLALGRLVHVVRGRSELVYSAAKQGR